MAMSAAEQIREEEQYRQVEAAMLHVDDAARRVQRTADALAKDGAPSHLVAALETAAGALRADHKRLIRSAYWQAPDDGQQELAPQPHDQDRLAS